MQIVHSLHKVIVQETYSFLTFDIESMLKRLQHEFENISNQSMSDPICFYDRLKFPQAHCGTGVYFIIYAPHAKYNFSTWSVDLGDDAEIMYVGQGNISQRKAVHLQIFRNKGNPKMFSKNSVVTSQVDSVAARKMYQHDPDLRNWRFSYILAEKNWSPLLEHYYIDNLKPKFNDEKMSGVA